MFNFQKVLRKEKNIKKSDFSIFGFNIKIRKENQL